MSGSPTVSLSGVGKSFGARKVADNISFDVAAGEVLCLLGASGSGKSTILRIIAGIERADEGRVSVGGVEVDSASAFVAPEKRRVGLVFQDLALFPHLNASGNAAFGLFRDSKAEAAARAAELLALVGLSDHARAFPHQLSGGEQQRLAVARALAPRPQAMLLDEPFSGLDDRLREGVRVDVLTLLRREGAATVFVTHDPDEALRSADRIVLMRNGVMAQQGSPADLLGAPADLGAAAFFSAINRFDARVSDGLAETPVGRVIAAGLAPGAGVVTAFRPRDFEVGAAGLAVRVSSAGMASDGLHVMATPEHGPEIVCILDSASAVRAGDVIHLTAKTGRGFVFPA
jgi:iron(III) transport system ATP-binding protein